MIKYLQDLFNPDMAVKFGEIDLGQIVDNEYKIKLIFKILEWILENNNNIEKPSQDLLNKWQSEVIKELENKYPNSGLKLDK